MLLTDTEQNKTARRYGHADACELKIAGEKLAQASEAEVMQ